MEAQLTNNEYWILLGIEQDGKKDIDIINLFYSYPEKFNRDLNDFMKVVEGLENNRLIQKKSPQKPLIYVLSRKGTIELSRAPLNNKDFFHLISDFPQLELKKRIIKKH